MDLRVTFPLGQLQLILVVDGITTTEVHLDEIESEFLDNARSGVEKSDVVQVIAQRSAKQKFHRHIVDLFVAFATNFALKFNSFLCYSVLDHKTQSAIHHRFRRFVVAHSESLGKFQLDEFFQLVLS